MSTTENTQGNGKKIEVFETVLKPLTDQKDGKIYCAFCGCFLGTKEGYHPCTCEGYEEGRAANNIAGRELLHKRGQAKLSPVPHPGD